MLKMISLLIIGILLATVGIINIRGNISTIRYFHRRRVSESDIPKYGKCIGAGCLIAGVCVIIAGVAGFVLKTDIFDYLLLSGVLLGIAIILYAQFRYNKGIF